MCQICDRFKLTPDRSSSFQRTWPSGPLFSQQTFTSTYGDQGLGLKILVSAVQSRPSPPFISKSCPSEIFRRDEFVTKFVTNSGTLQRIPAHEDVIGETSRVELRSLRLLRVSSLDIMGFLHQCWAVSPRCSIHWAHNPKVAGSNPAPDLNQPQVTIKDLFRLRVLVACPCYGYIASQLAD